MGAVLFCDVRWVSELRTTYIRPPHEPHEIWMGVKPNTAGAFCSFSLYWRRNDVPDDAATFSTRFTFCPCLGGPVWVLCIIRCFSRDAFFLLLFTYVFLSICPCLGMCTDDISFGTGQRKKESSRTRYVLVLQSIFSFYQSFLRSISYQSS